MQRILSKLNLIEPDQLSSSDLISILCKSIFISSWNLPDSELWKSILETLSGLVIENDLIEHDLEDDRCYRQLIRHMWPLITLTEDFYHEFAETYEPDEMEDNDTRKAYAELMCMDIILRGMKKMKFESYFAPEDVEQINLFHATVIDVINYLNNNTRDVLSKKQCKKIHSALLNFSSIETDFTCALESRRISAYKKHRRKFWHFRKEKDQTLHIDKDQISLAFLSDFLQTKQDC